MWSWEVRQHLRTRHRSLTMVSRLYSGMVGIRTDNHRSVRLGTLESIGEKLAKKRGGKVVNAQARETDGIVFYQYEFENPVDNSLPRPKNSR